MGNERLIKAIALGQAAHPKVRISLPYVGPMEATAVRWLSPEPENKRKLGALNYCDTPWKDAELPAGIAWVSAYLAANHRLISHDAEATVRAHLAAWLLRTGKGAGAQAALVDWLKSFHRKDAGELWPRQRKAALAQFKAQGVTGHDAASLDAIFRKRLAKG